MNVVNSVETVSPVTKWARMYPAICPMRARIGSRRWPCWCAYTWLFKQWHSSHDVTVLPLLRWRASVNPHVRNREARIGMWGSFREKLAHQQTWRSDVSLLTKILTTLSAAIPQNQEWSMSSHWWLCVFMPSILNSLFKSLYEPNSICVLLHIQKITRVSRFSKTVWSGAYQLVLFPRLCQGYNSVSLL